MSDWTTDLDYPSICLICLWVPCSLGVGLVLKCLLGWWQKSQMSDSEKIEKGHVMKEPEVNDLERWNITRSGLIKIKRDGGK